MQPLQRKMFANGDEVLERVSSTSQINPKEYVFTLEERDGRPVAVKRQVSGLQQEEPEVFEIDLKLSPTGDPREAFERQRSNQMFSNIQTGGAALSMLPLTQTKAAGSILTGLGGLGIKYGPKVASFINKTLNPFKTRLRSPVDEGLRGMPSRNPYKLSSYEFGVNPTGAVITGGGALYGATEAGQIDEEDVKREKDIATELAILEATNRTEYKDTAKKSIELAIKVAIAEGDTEQVELLQQELVKYEDKGPPMQEVAGKDSEATIEEIDPESLAKKRTLAESIEKFGSETSKEPRERKETPFLQNKNFLDLMRNIGIQMVETGDIGMGISQGSAETLKEQKAAQLTFEARESELEKIAYEYGLDLSNAVDLEKAKSIYADSELVQFQLKEDIKTRNDLVNNPETSSKMAETVLSVETSDVALNYLKQAKTLIEAGDVTGVSPAIQEAVNKAFRFLGKPVPLSPREKAKGLLAFVAKADVKELLGESGRTISNIDREIARELVGAIDFTTGAEDVLEQLDKSIGKYERVRIKNKGLYDGYYNLYQRFDLMPPHMLGKSLDETRGKPVVRIQMSDYSQ